MVPRALPPERLSRGSGGTSQLHHVDVWPLNLLRPRGGPGYVDVCGLFLLQMATILGMVPAWHSARLRIFLCLGPREAPGAAEGRLRALLSQLRIRAEVREVVWGEGAASEEPEEEEDSRRDGELGETSPAFWAAPDWRQLLAADIRGSRSWHVVAGVSLRTRMDAEDYS